MPNDRFTEEDIRKLKEKHIKLSDAQEYGDENATEYNCKEFFNVENIIYLKSMGISGLDATKYKKALTDIMCYDMVSLKNDGINANDAQNYADAGAKDWESINEFRENNISSKKAKKYGGKDGFKTVDDIKLLIDNNVLPQVAKKYVKLGFPEAEDIVWLADNNISARVADKFRDAGVKSAYEMEWIMGDKIPLDFVKVCFGAGFRKREDVNYLHIQKIDISAESEAYHGEKVQDNDDIMQLIKGNVSAAEFSVYDRIGCKSIENMIKFKSDKTDINKIEPYIQQEIHDPNIIRWLIEDKIPPDYAKVYLDYEFKERDDLNFLYGKKINKDTLEGYKHAKIQKPDNIMKLIKNNIPYQDVKGYDEAGFLSTKAICKFAGAKVSSEIVKKYAKVKLFLKRAVGGGVSSSPISLEAEDIIELSNAKVDPQYAVDLSNLIFVTSVTHIVKAFQKNIKLEDIEEYKSNWGVKLLEEILAFRKNAEKKNKGSSNNEINELSPEAVMVSKYRLTEEKIAIFKKVGIKEIHKMVSLMRQYQLKYEIKDYSTEDVEHLALLMRRGITLASWEILKKSLEITDPVAVCSIISLAQSGKFGSSYTRIDPRVLSKEEANHLWGIINSLRAHSGKNAKIENILKQESNNKKVLQEKNIDEAEIQQYNNAGIFLAQDMVNLKDKGVNGDMAAKYSENGILTVQDMIKLKEENIQLNDRYAKKHNIVAGENAVQEIMQLKKNKPNIAIENFKKWNITTEEGWNVSREDALKMLSLTGNKIKRTASWIYSGFTNPEIFEAGQKLGQKVLGTTFNTFILRVAFPGCRLYCSKLNNMGANIPNDIVTSLRKLQLKFGIKDNDLNFENSQIRKLLVCYSEAFNKYPKNTIVPKVTGNRLINPRQKVVFVTSNGVDIKKVSQNIKDAIGSYTYILNKIL